jgi:L-alanine-DL-glutamate epimerase-like enolase superfamily enzyme
VREAIGPDIKLMCDINQRWRVEQAIDIGRRVEDAGVGLFWLEDVTTADDFAGLARVTAALSTPPSAIDPSRATQASRREWFFMPPERTLGLRGGSCSFMCRVSDAGPSRAIHPC